jgi:ribosome-binding protein aMBF1 (putative translation factor)
MSGAPIGNKNAAKGKIWNDALRRAIASDQGERVRKAANKLIDEAAAGAPWAIKELAERLDGKASALDFWHEENDLATKFSIHVVFVKPSLPYELSQYETGS